MSNGTYKRNGSPESSTWKTDQAYFQGFTRAKLEDIEKKINGVCDLAEKNKDEIGKVKVMAAFIGGAAGTVTGFLRGFF